MRKNLRPKFEEQYSFAVVKVELTISKTDWPIIEEHARRFANLAPNDVRWTTGDSLCVLLQNGIDLEAERQARMKARDPLADDVRSAGSEAEHAIVSTA